MGIKSLFKEAAVESRSRYDNSCTLYKTKLTVVQEERAKLQVQLHAPRLIYM